MLRRDSLRFSDVLQSEGWARQDSNLGPRDYESPALTAELQARAITYSTILYRFRGLLFTPARDCSIQPAAA